MSLKIPFLDLHLNFFPTNLSTVSDEHGECFLQEINMMDERYQGKWSPSMLADCYWTMVRIASEVRYNHKSSVATFQVKVICNLYFDIIVSPFN
jgi:hypothetical protein